MADSVAHPEAWLPFQLQTKTGVPMERENFKSGPSFCFPTEFPYEFDSFGPHSSLSSPVESVAGSTENESSDEEDFFAGLTRRLAQSSLHETQKLAFRRETRNKPEWVMAGSPQSTLGGIGSWSGRSAVSSNGSSNGPSQVPSPPTTPFGASNDALDVIYAAAGQVARLKMSGESPKNSYQSRGLLAPPMSTTPVSTEKSCYFGLYSNQSVAHNLPQVTQFQHARQDRVLKPQPEASIWGRQDQMKLCWSAEQNLQEPEQIHSRVRNTGFESGRCGRPLSVPQPAWPSLHAQPKKQPSSHSGSSMRAVFRGGSGVKRDCAGTGVFLPRRYSSAPDIRKKSGCPTVIVPAKVVQALNLNFDDISGHAQPRFNAGFTFDHGNQIFYVTDLLE
ncbi:hypothetical protein I3843_02G164900 [Carya illinoinensis]|uniref:Uncharacterized protein n=1 Tax=Carya illinoinensis TaxID=32201 RepID=A0A922FZG2_CARIL|nr:hypothetical protein I3842_02G185700 [Carya illinoinensis]KAG7993178.1 hypothetical protein I3843_02G164900 [Carya illinoinensis]